MEREVAGDIIVACEKTMAAIEEVEAAIQRITDEAERGRLHSALARAVVEVLRDVRAPAVAQHPDLAPREDMGSPDAEPSAEQQQCVARLSATDLQEIDDALLAACTASWRKVARVVLAAMITLQARFPGVPDGWYAQRVGLLVSSGRLHLQGNHDRMRFAEVKLALGGDGDA